MRLKAIIASLAGCLAVGCVADAVRADLAEFTVHADGRTTAEVNGSPIALPVGFGLTWRDGPAAEGGTLFVLTSHLAAPNSYSDIWTGGLAGSFPGWNGLVGYFSSATYPSGTAEPYPHSLVLDGYAMDRLRGEPVRFVDLGGGDTLIRIGGPPPLLVADVFDFLDAYFAGRPVADFNHSGALTVQDVFDFLAWWAGG